MASQVTCPYCESSFKNKAGLTSHIRNVHEESKQEKQVKVVSDDQIVTNINYCPCCGYNLKILVHAMAAIGDLQNGSD